MLWMKPMSSSSSPGSGTIGKAPYRLAKSPVSTSCNAGTSPGELLQTALIVLPKRPSTFPGFLPHSTTRRCLHGKRCTQRRSRSCILPRISLAHVVHDALRIKIKSAHSCDLRGDDFRRFLLGILSTCFSSPHPPALSLQSHLARKRNRLQINI